MSIVMVRIYSPRMIRASRPTYNNPVGEFETRGDAARRERLFAAYFARERRAARSLRREIAGEQVEPCMIDGVSL